jgi:hypothetical protein
VVFIIFLLQLPTVALKFFQHGVSELTIGTYGTHGGSLTTAFSLTAAIYLLSYYGLYKPKNIYLLLTAGFLLWSIAGEKRAVFFLLPFVFLGMYYLIYVRGKKINPLKHIFIFAAFGLAIIFSGMIFLICNPTLNPEGKIGGSFDPVYAFNYAKKYTTDTSRTGYTHGRISTSKRVFQVLKDSGISHSMFGFGPGSYTYTAFDSPKLRFKRSRIFKIRYGITPIALIAIEYGLFGVIVYFLMIIHFTSLCMKYYKLETDPYWKAFAAGSTGYAFLMLFFFFAYHRPIWFGDTSPVLYFYVMAVVYIRQQKVKLQHSIQP